MSARDEAIAALRGGPRLVSEIPTTHHRRTIVHALVRLMHEGSASREEVPCMGGVSHRYRLTSEPRRVPPRGWVRAEIVEAVREGYTTAPEIAEYLGRDPGAVAQHLCHLAGRQVRRVGQRELGPGRTPATVWEAM